MTEENTVITQQSFSEARQKIKWNAFYELFQLTVKLSYSDFFETWHGYKVFAIDGTKVQLPTDKALTEHFGALGKDATATTAQASALYDVYNNVIVDALMEPMSIDERTLATTHVENLIKLNIEGKTLILFDRGYPSFELIETLKGAGISFVMRVKTKFNKDIDAQTDDDGHVVLSKLGHEDICARVLKFDLSSGEQETLITNLEDKRMGIVGFKALYFKRWPIETKYDEIKNKLELSNFSSLLVDNLKQDFYTTMFFSNLLASACKEADLTIKEKRTNKNNKYTYKPNVNDSVGTLRDNLVKIFLKSSIDSCLRLLQRVLLLMTINPTPNRSDRSFSRDKKPRDSKFYYNRKSNC